VLSGLATGGRLLRCWVNLVRRQGRSRRLASSSPWPHSARRSIHTSADGWITASAWTRRNLHLDLSLNRQAHLVDADGGQGTTPRKPQFGWAKRGQRRPPQAKRNRRSEGVWRMNPQATGTLDTLMACKGSGVQIPSAPPGTTHRQGSRSGPFARDLPESH
jgi:hypothetical protein